MEKIVIVGAGGFGREVKIIIDAINEVERKFDFLGFYDDGFNLGALINGYPILGSIADLNSTTESIAVAIAIGSPQVKYKVLSINRNLEVKLINKKRINVFALILFLLKSVLIMVCYRCIFNG